MMQIKLFGRNGLPVLAAALGGILSILAPAISAGARWPHAQAAVARYAAGGSRHGLHHYIADLKTSFPEHQSYTAATALTESNYRAVLMGLKTNVGADGVRVPIFPEYSRAADYSPLYRDIYNYARHIGLRIYASPLSVGMSRYAGWSPDEYAAWVADYANTFRPDYLSPFNEPGISNERLAEIVTALRSDLRVRVALVGPDRQHVDRSISDLRENERLFDIVSSHNAARDGSATSRNWGRLVRLAHKPVWASENPAGWARGNSRGLPGVNQAVAGGVQGVVMWKAKPSLVDDRGQPTERARDMSAHLGLGRQ